MELEHARAVAQDLVAELAPFCSQIAVAGSIRRRKALVNDVDIVLIPTNQGRLAVKLHEMGAKGQKAIRLVYKGIPADVYLASEETWAMLLLLRTGSAAFNRSLALRAIRLGLHFAANGQGILKDGARVAWRSEEEIFQALGLKYIEPSNRERL